VLSREGIVNQTTDEIFDLITDNCFGKEDIKVIIDDALGVIVDSIEGGLSVEIE
jgi:hypothetical protein